MGRATHGEAGRERIGRAYPPVPIAKIGNKTTEDLGVHEYRNRVFLIPVLFITFCGFLCNTY